MNTTLIRHFSILLLVISSIKSARADDALHITGPEKWCIFVETEFGESYLCDDPSKSSCKSVLQVLKRKYPSKYSNSSCQKRPPSNAIASEAARERAKIKKMAMRSKAEAELKEREKLARDTWYDNWEKELLSDENVERIERQRRIDILNLQMQAAELDQQATSRNREMMSSIVDKASNLGRTISTGGRKPTSETHAPQSTQNVVDKWPNSQLLRWDFSSSSF